MPRPSRAESTAPGQDSFLDIMTNMVGILIILVMMVAARVRNAPAQAPETPQAQEQLTQEKQTEQSLTADIYRLTSDMRTLGAHLQQRFAERNRLSTTVAAAEQAVQQGRQSLDTAAQQEFDLRQNLAAAQAQLEAIEQQRRDAQQRVAAPEQIECYPTALGKIVDDDEAHFQIRAGRITFVPFDELIKRFKSDAEQKVYKLRDQKELTETVGPLGGFRMRYTIRRFDTAVDERVPTSRGGSYVRLVQCDLIPVAGDLGEPVDAALGPNSEFRQILATFRPGRTTVTLWTYPDSFGSFNRVKKELYQMGFATAGRPLPEGTFIGGSPEGSKSHAE